MNTAQPAILATETELARFITFRIVNKVAVKICLQALAGATDGNSTVVGLGYSLVSVVGKQISGLHTFPSQSNAGIDIPSTPGALWLWLRGSDRGELFHRSRQLESLLAPAFAIDDIVDCFQYQRNRDMTGYEDGTENPQADAAIAAAIVQQQGAGLDGSSFVAVQQWLHDFAAFDTMSDEQQDNVIGRRRSDNEEMDDAPISAHVKRAAQESFEPEAFIVRRSMPWASEMDAGLYFVAFGKSFNAYERLLQRMIGIEDGVSDALFSISQPISGAYFWCPPMKNNKLDLSALGL